MAIDEALFQHARDTGRTAIRFYEFKKPSIVLSYSDHPDNAKRENLEGVELLRRITAGKPIYVHSGTLSYSIAGPLNVPGSAGVTSVVDVHNYFGTIIAEAIASVINAPDVKVELGKAYSIRANGKPIAGHGQHLTTGSAFLYQGIITILPWDADLIDRLLHIRREDFEELKVLPSVKAISTVQMSADEYKARLIRKILARVYDPGTDQIDSREMAEIMQKANDLKAKYTSDDWTMRARYASDGQPDGREITLKLDSRFCLLFEG
jgi:lipoate-protein ligase A